MPISLKHDGHRLVTIVANGAVKLLSRNERDRTELFRVEEADSAGLLSLLRPVPKDRQSSTAADR